MLDTAPFMFRWLFPRILWHCPRRGKTIYLTFDDGPTPGITEQVLEMLERYQACATFFCVGNNVAQYPQIYDSIIKQGHQTGNHTHHHLKGWETGTGNYLDDVQACHQVVRSTLFRPPYGKMSLSQYRRLRKQYTVVMWDVLSRDFDGALKPEQCLKVVLAKARPGSIVVFHDSRKAWERLEYTLPRVLQHFAEQGYRFEKIPDVIR